MLDTAHRFARADAVCILVGKCNDVALRIFIITKQAQKVNKNRLELCPRRERTKSYSFLSGKPSKMHVPKCPCVCYAYHSMLILATITHINTENIANKMLNNFLLPYKI